MAQFKQHHQRLMCKVNKHRRDGSELQAHATSHIKKLILHHTVHAITHMHVIFCPRQLGNVHTPLLPNSVNKKSLCLI